MVGIKSRSTRQVRATHVTAASKSILQSFIVDNVEPGSMVYTDEHRSYSNLRHGFRHMTVVHSVSQYVEGQAHTNGIESFWATLKRAYKGTYHKMSPKHLQRYVVEFAGRHNNRDLDTLEQMELMVLGMEGKRLTWRALAS